MRFSSLSIFSVTGIALVAGQLSGPVGPTTDIATKRAKKVCDVTKYGAVADKTTDIGPAINSAWADCKSGGVVVIPEGEYAMSTWVTLSGGSGWALQLDGIIYRTGTAGGNMFMIKRTSDFEMFSSTSKGAIQALGYEYHKDGNLGGPRILRLAMVDTFSVHDVALVDAPAFHFSMDTCTNGEVYNLAIRGGNSGGLDGIDVWSTNMWIHDVMVTNKDECVTIKSPAKNILVENIYCNWSGGSAFGSLGGSTNISDIIYRNIYTTHSNQMMMIKSNGGGGFVENVLLENFIGHSNAYSLDVDQYWSSMSALDGEGVQLNNFTFKNWKGSAADGNQRGPIKVICAEGAPCTNMVIEDFAMWTESGSIVKYTCANAYGSGGCLKDGANAAAAYTAITSTISAAPAGYTAATMAEDLTTHFGVSASIPIPTLPASFFPGIQPYSAFAGNSGAGSSASTSQSSASASASATSASSTAASPTSAASAVEFTGKATTLSNTLVPTSSLGTTNSITISSPLVTPTSMLSIPLNTSTPITSVASFVSTSSDSPVSLPSAASEIQQASSVAAMPATTTGRPDCRGRNCGSCRSRRLRRRSAHMAH